MKIKAKKSLGQNFLIDKNIINKIISISNISGKDVLEIGPGTGNLTEYILKEKPNKLILVEKDRDLSEKLHFKFQNKVNIINTDILKINEKNLSNNRLIVFGNLPYNISTEIICNWILKLDNKIWFNELILMFQKEVADRIISIPKKSYFIIKKSKNLEMITRIFFNQRRKMIKNPFKHLFINYEEISEKLGLDLRLRPQNLSLENYCNIVKEYEKLNS